MRSMRPGFSNISVLALCDVGAKQSEFFRFAQNDSQTPQHLIRYDRPAAVRYDRCAWELGYLHAEYGSASATGDHFLECIRNVSCLRRRAIHDPHWMRAGYDPRV